MKSYFLEGLNEELKARDLLSSLLPHQTDPWLVQAQNGESIAYMNIYAKGDGLYIQVDISGRHFNEDSIVLEILRQLQTQLGGEIRNDDDDSE